jgi:hypothetical protein
MILIVIHKLFQDTLFSLCVLSCFVASQYVLYYELEEYMYSIHPQIQTL